MSTSSSSRRGLRVVVRGVVGAVLLVVLGAIGVALCLRHLEWGPCKALVRASVERATGLSVDYERLSIGLAGTLEARNLRVRNPSPWDAHAGDLLRIGRLEARVRVASLWNGRPEIEEVHVEDVGLVLVQDAQGRGSLDAFRRPEASEPAAEPAGGGRFLEALDVGVTLRDLRVSGLSLARVRVTAQGESVDRLQGLGVEASLEGFPDGPKGRLRIRSDPQTGLTISRTDPDGNRRGATLEGILEVQVDGREASIPGLDWSVRDQDLDPRLPPQGALLRATARAGLDTPGGLWVMSLRGEILGAMTLEATLEVEDRRRGNGVAWTVRELGISGDSGRVPQWVWALVPEIEVRDGTLSVRSGGFGRTASGQWRLPVFLSLEGRAERVAWRPARGTPAEMEGLVLRGSGGQEDPEAMGPSIECSGRRLGVGRDGWRVETGPWTVVARLEDLRQGLQTGRWAGRLGLSIDEVSVDAVGGSLRGRKASLALRGEGGPGLPVRGEGEVTLGHLGLRLPKGSVLEPGPVRLVWRAQDWVLADPIPASRGRFWASLDSPWARVELETRLEDGRARIGVGLSSSSMSFASPWLPRAIPLHRMAVSGRIDALLGDLGSPDPEVQGTWTLAVERPEAPRGFLAASRATFQGAVSGRPSRPEAQGTLTLASPRIAGHPLADLAEVSARLLARPGGLRTEVDLRAVRGGRVLAEGRSRAEMAGDRWDLEGRGFVTGSPELVALLPQDVRDRMDGERLHLDWTFRSRLEGLARLGPRDLLPTIFPDALRRARGRGDLEIRVRDLSLRGPATGPLEGLRIVGHGEAGEEGLRGTLLATLDDARLRTAREVHRIGGLGVRAALSWSPGDSVVALDLEARLAEWRREGASGYPVGDLSLSARGRLVPFSVLRLDSLSLDNPAGGTRLQVQAALEDARAGDGPESRIPVVLGHRSLNLQGTLTQDLSRVGLDPWTFRGRGTIEVPFQVESGDWTLFRIAGSVQAREVDAEVPGASLAVEGLDGLVSVFEEVALGEGGRIVLVGGREPNEITRMRFPDVQPFLGRGAYVTFRRFRAGPVTLGPGAGNLRIAGRTVALDQMEAEWQGGKATGQLILDHRPGDTTMRFRGSVTGVRAGDGEDPRARLDANGALVVSLDRMEAEGRAQVIRVGRGHLRKALEVLDPTYENVAMNRIRKYLAYGHPRYVQVRLDRGFLSAKVDLGGLASVVRIDEIRGVPTGPLLRRLLGPLVPREGDR